MRSSGGETGGGSGGWYHGWTAASPVGGQHPAPLMGKPSPAWATPARKELFRPSLRLDIVSAHLFSWLIRFANKLPLTKKLPPN
jgi:hypothetical protein